MKWYHTVGIIAVAVFFQFCLMSIAYNYGAIHTNIECMMQSLDRIGKNLDDANKRLSQ